MEHSAMKLGVNIDHIATLRQLRGTPYPDMLEAGRLVEAAGADQVTVHLREDRRHIQDADVALLRSKLKIALNLEMAATEAMLKIALKVKPDWVCLVPEKRQEVTTEGGLDLAKNRKRVAPIIARLKKAGIRVSCFIEPSLQSVKLAAEFGSTAVEFHTGRFCLATQKSGASAKKQAAAELSRIVQAAALARKLRVRPHAGHGFDYENVRAVAELVNADGSPLIEEYNIGHAVVCRAAMVGLERAVREMIASIRAP